MDTFYRIETSINKALQKAQVITVLSEKKNNGEVIHISDKDYSEEELTRSSIEQISSGSEWDSVCPWL